MEEFTGFLGELISASSVARKALGIVLATEYAMLVLMALGVCRKFLPHLYCLLCAELFLFPLPFYVMGLSLKAASAVLFVFVSAFLLRRRTRG